jgi:hypothetical protein
VLTSLKAVPGRPSDLNCRSIKLMMLGEWRMSRTEAEGGVASVCEGKLMELSEAVVIGSGGLGQVTDSDGVSSKMAVAGTDEEVGPATLSGSRLLFRFPPGTACSFVRHNANFCRRFLLLRRFAKTFLGSFIAVHIFATTDANVFDLSRVWLQSWTAVLYKF